MYSSDRVKLFFVALLTALLPLTAFSVNSVIPTKAVEVHLDSDIKVGGEQVVLGDVATIYAKSLQDFKALSGLVLSKIPEDKREVKLPASYLEARVRAALPPGAEFALRAPKEIIFRLERVGVAPQEVATEIARMGRAAGKIPEGVEVEVVPLSGLEQLAGYTLATTVIEPSAELQRWKGEMQFKVTKAGSGAPPVWVKAKVRWFQNVWVASRSLMFTETPSASHFVLGKVETTALREEPIAVSSEDLPEFLKLARIKRQIPAKSPLLPSMLDRKPDTAAGSLLRVVFISESGVRVSADGALLVPGSIGSDVKARLRSSKKIVTGKLVSQSLMEVSL